MAFTISPSQVLLIRYTAHCKVYKDLTVRPIKCGQSIVGPGINLLPFDSVAVEMKKRLMNRRLLRSNEP